MSVKYDFSEIELIQYDYNIWVILKKKSIEKFPRLNFDIGNLNLFKKYFPFEPKEGFSGDFINLNF